MDDYQISSVFDVMARCESRPGRGHVFVILTKRPARMRSWMVEQFPRLIPLGLPLANVWLGVSCWDQPSVDAMVPILLNTPAAHRVVSLEPLLGPIDLDPLYPGTFHSGDYAAQLDQVLVGGETGPGARPCDVGWVRAIVNQCREAGVPCHFKQPGRWVAGDHAGFQVDRWLIEVGGVWVPPIIGPHIHARPENAVAFGTTKDPDGWPEDLRAAHGPGSLAWGSCE